MGSRFPYRYAGLPRRRWSDQWLTGEPAAEPLTAVAQRIPVRPAPVPEPAGNDTEQNGPSGREEPSSAAERIEELESALAQAREAEARLVRDFQNYRRHAEADLEQAEGRARRQLLAELADTVQALERAGSAAETDPDAVREGVALVARSLEKLFDRHGLERIPTRGADFDPKLHEAVLTERVEGVERGTIVRELSPGFRTEDEVVRPAKVSVAA